MDQEGPTGTSPLPACAWACDSVHWVHQPPAWSTLHIPVPVLPHDDDDGGRGELGWRVARAAGTSRTLRQSSLPVRGQRTGTVACIL